MNKNKHLISRYLEGELDSIAASRFEEELKKDPALRREFELYKEVDEALADSEVINLRMQLQEIHENYITAPKTAAPGIKRISVLTLAASLAVILGFSIFSLFRFDNQQIVKKYYQAYEITSTNRSVITDANIILRDAFEKYQNKEYREAVTLFEKVLIQNPGQMGAQLYSGISYFELAEYRKASTSFSRVIHQNDNLYIEQAKWYLGFCYLKTEENDKAIKEFTEIANSNSFYSQKAKEILKKLK